MFAVSFMDVVGLRMQIDDANMSMGGGLQSPELQGFCPAALAAFLVLAASRDPGNAARVPAHTHWVKSRALQTM